MEKPSDQTTAPTEEKPTKEKRPRKPYATPTLTPLGTVAELTRGTGGSVPDSLGGNQTGGGSPKPRR